MPLLGRSLVLQLSHATMVMTRGSLGEGAETHQQQQQQHQQSSSVRQQDLALEIGPCFSSIFG